MALNTPEEILKHLEGQLALERPGLERLDKYYEGEQPLKYMAPILQEELGDRVTQLVINWPQLGVDAYENRLDLEGFRLPGQSEADDELWRIWQDNDLDELSQQAHLEALALKRSYAIVGVNEDEPETPLITVEHPLQVITMQDPRTRRVAAGMKRWKDLNDTERATLYLPDEDRHYRLDSGEWVEIADDRNVHNRGLCAVVPIVNRPRMLRPLGKSEFASIIPVADAANKMATDMMISGEYHAMPRRVWFGMSEDDFVDENGKPLSVWSRLAGREWATELRKGTEVDVQQFTEADLSVFRDTIKLLAQLASQLLALPPHYMQFGGQNPASADAIRSSEAQLVKRAERKQRIFGGSWETVMRLASLIANGEDDRDLRRLEAIWRDASTPTVAQKADAAVKLYAAPPGQTPIVPLRQTREDLGYTDTQIKLMEAEDARARLLDPVAAIARDLAGTNDDSASADAGA